MFIQHVYVVGAAILNKLKISQSAERGGYLLRDLTKGIQGIGTMVHHTKLLK